MKKFFALGLLATIVTSACSPKTNVGCPTNQICTMIFASVGTTFVDKDGNNVAVKDFKVLNLRTNKAIESQGVIGGGDASAGQAIVTDANKKDLSTEGDELKVTAVTVNGNKPVSAVYKISGGCNCHVEKLSGPEKIVVN